MFKHLMLDTIFPNVWIDSGGVLSTRASEDLTVVCSGNLALCVGVQVPPMSLTVHLSPWEMCPKVITLRG